MKYYYEFETVTEAVSRIREVIDEVTWHLRDLPVWEESQLQMHFEDIANLLQEITVDARRIEQ